MNKEGRENRFRYTEKGELTETTPKSILERNKREAERYKKKRDKERASRGE